MSSITLTPPSAQDLAAAPGNRVYANEGNVRPTLDSDESVVRDTNIPVSNPIPIHIQNNVGPHSSIPVDSAEETERMEERGQPRDMAQWSNQHGEADAVLNKADQQGVWGKATQKMMHTVSDAAPQPHRSEVPTIPTAGIEGLLQAGNIDLNNRPVIKNADGTHSTEYSISFSDDTGREILVPTIVNGKFLTPNGQKPAEGSQAEKDMFKRAAQRYEDTHEHMGIFDSVANAEAYARTAHNASRLGKTPMYVANSAPAALPHHSRTVAFPNGAIVAYPDTMSDSAFAQAATSTWQQLKSAVQPSAEFLGNELKGAAGTITGLPSAIADSVSIKPTAEEQKNLGVSANPSLAEKSALALYRNIGAPLQNAAQWYGTAVKHQQSIIDLIPQDVLAQGLGAGASAAVLGKATEAGAGEFERTLTPAKKVSQAAKVAQVAPLSDESRTAAAYLRAQRAEPTPVEEVTGRNERPANEINLGGKTQGPAIPSADASADEVREYIRKQWGKDTADAILKDDESAARGTSEAESADVNAYLSSLNDKGIKFDEPASFSLGKARKMGNGVIEHPILDKEGNPAGVLNVTISPKGEATINWIGSPQMDSQALSNQIGRKGLMNLRDDFSDMHPEVKTVVGKRLGGSRGNELRTVKVNIEKPAPKPAAPTEDITNELSNWQDTAQRELGGPKN